MTSWQERYEKAPVEEMQRVGSPGWEAFVRQSGVITDVIHQKLLDHVPASGLAPGSGRILDFGAGIGRVALNLAARIGMPTDACDVNEAAMSYLSAQLPGTRCEATPYDPPLPYDDETFDAVYSISVWTHLPVETGLAWLAEIARILKPGGAALISLCGPVGVEMRGRHAPKGWPATLPEDLEREGVIFVSYGEAGQPGVSGDYGLSAHSHGYVTGVFGETLAVEAIYPGIIDGIQDLVVLRKRAQGAPAVSP